MRLLLFLLLFTPALTGQIVWEKTYRDISRDQHVEQSGFNGTYFGVVGHTDRPPLGASAPKFWLFDTLGQLLLTETADLPHDWNVKGQTLLPTPDGFYALVWGSRSANPWNRDVLLLYRWGMEGLREVYRRELPDGERLFIPHLRASSAGAAFLWSGEVTGTTPSGVHLAYFGADGALVWAQDRAVGDQLFRAANWRTDADDFAVSFRTATREMTQFFDSSTGQILHEHHRPVSTADFQQIDFLGFDPVGNLRVYERYGDNVIEANGSFYDQRLYHGISPNGEHLVDTLPDTYIDTVLAYTHLRGANVVGPVYSATFFLHRTGDVQHIQLDWNLQIVDTLPLTGLDNVWKLQYTPPETWTFRRGDSLWQYRPSANLHYGFPGPRSQRAGFSHSVHAVTHLGAGYLVGGQRHDANGRPEMWYERRDRRGNLELRSIKRDELPISEVLRMIPRPGGYFALEHARDNRRLYGHWLDDTLGTVRRYALSGGWNLSRVQAPARVVPRDDTLYCLAKDVYMVANDTGGLRRNLNLRLEYGWRIQSQLTAAGRLVLYVEDTRELWFLTPRGDLDRPLDWGRAGEVDKTIDQLVPHPDGWMVVYHQRAPEGSAERYETVYELRDEMGQVRAQYTVPHRWRIGGEFLYDENGHWNLSTFQYLRYADTTLVDRRPPPEYASYHSVTNGRGLLYRVRHQTYYNRQIAELQIRYPDLPLAASFDRVPAAEELLVVPNPHRGTFRWRLIGDWTYPIRVDITDVLGRVQWSRDYPTEPDGGTFFVRNAGLEPGNYFIGVRDVAGRRRAVGMVVR